MNHLTTNLINAAKRRKTIEYKDSDGNWQPFTAESPDILVDIANTPEEIEIRIQPKFMSYRPYMYIGGSYDAFRGEPSVTMWCDVDGSEEEVEADSSFIKWLDVKKTIQVSS